MKMNNPMSELSRRGFLGLGAGAVALAGCGSVEDPGRLGSGTSGSAAGDATVAGGCATEVRIAHIGDPQFAFCGYGRSAEERQTRHEEFYAADLARMERVIRSVNAAKVDLAVISGDVTDRAADVVRDWPRLLKEFEVPVIVVPGNHDLGNSATFENYERFRSVFGTDHQLRKLGGFAIIAANSQFSRETAELKRQQREHEEWFFDELKTVSSKGLVPIVATHIGPYVHGRGEADGYESFPKNGLRERVLEACGRAGVRFWLGGHTHAAYLHMCGEMTILNAQSICHNFDSSPFGWHLLRLDLSGDWSWNLRRI